MPSCVVQLIISSFVKRNRIRMNGIELRETELATGMDVRATSQFELDRIEAGADTLNKKKCFVGIGIGQQENEFIATGSCDQIALAKGVACDGGDGEQVDVDGLAETL